MAQLGGGGGEYWKTPLFPTPREYFGFFLLELSLSMSFRADTPVLTGHRRSAQPPSSYASGPCPTAPCGAQACPLCSAGPWHLASLRELQPAQRLLIKQQCLDSHPELGGLGRVGPPLLPPSGWVTTPLHRYGGMGQGGHETYIVDSWGCWLWGGEGS